MKIDKLLKLDHFLIKRIIEYSLTQIYIDDLFLINDKHTNLIIACLKSKKSNNKCDLPNNYQAIKSYNYFKIEKINKEENYEYILKDEVILPNKMVIRKLTEKEGLSNNIIRLNSKDLTLPLIVRSRKMVIEWQSKI